MRKSRFFSNPPEAAGRGGGGGGEAIQGINARWSRGKGAARGEQNMDNDEIFGKLEGGSSAVSAGNAAEDSASSSSEKQKRKKRTLMVIESSSEEEDEEEEVKAENGSRNNISGCMSLNTLRNEDNKAAVYDNDIENDDNKFDRSLTARLKEQREAKHAKTMLLIQSSDDDDEGVYETTQNSDTGPGNKRKAVEITESDDSDSSSIVVVASKSMAKRIVIPDVHSDSSSSSSFGGRTRKRKKIIKKKQLTKGTKETNGETSKYDLNIMDELRSDLHKKKKATSSSSSDKRENKKSEKCKHRYKPVMSAESSSGGEESSNDWSGGEEDDVVGELFSRCEKISQNLLSAIECINNDLDSKSGPSNPLPSSSSQDSFRLTTRAEADRLFPDDLSLKQYQLVGLNWLQVLYDQELNGILADEMGLGKTVQAIAVLAWLKSVKSIKGPHLIIAPASTLENWRRELSRWVPGQKVIVYHGSQQHRAELVEKMRPRQKSGLLFDIMLTTYTYFERDSCSSDRAFLSKYMYSYIITDEAHGIKNMNSSRYRRMVRLKSKRRLLLTGTPVQNNLEEILALMSFCMPKVFDASSDKLGEYFRATGRQERKETSRIREAMKPFVLRRLKSDVLGQLSPKVEDVRILPQHPKQKAVYDDIVYRYKARKDVLTGVGAGGSFTHFFSELRKACNHPLLVQNLFGRSAGESSDGVDRSMPRVVDLLLKARVFGAAATREMIRKEVAGYSDWSLHMMAVEFGPNEPEIKQLALPDDVLWNSCKAIELKRLMPQLVQDGHRFLIFSQWTTILDLVEEMTKMLGITYVRFDGQTAVGDRQTIIDTFNTDMSYKCCLISTRAGGMGVNLTSADTVILHDLDFNPALDRQAEDRCHRIGQTKTVRIVKLVTKDTVDERIMDMQTEKKILDECLLKSNNTPNKVEGKKTKTVDPIKLIMSQL